MCTCTPFYVCYYPFKAKYANLMHTKDGRARKRTGKTPPKYIDGTMQCSKHPLIEVMLADLNFSANEKCL